MIINCSFISDVGDYEWILVPILLVDTRVWMKIVTVDKIILFHWVEQGCVWLWQTFDMKDGSSWMPITSNDHPNTNKLDLCLVFYVPILDLPMLSCSMNFSSKSSCSIFSNKLYITWWLSSRSIFCELEFMF